MYQDEYEETTYSVVGSSANGIKCTTRKREFEDEKKGHGKAKMKKKYMTEEIPEFQKKLYDISE